MTRGATVHLEAASHQLGDYMSAREDRAYHGGVTKRWDICDRHGGRLGDVRWYGAWRQYVFVPNEITMPLFNAGCLREIADFCVARTSDHRAERARQTGRR